MIDAGRRLHLRCNNTTKAARWLSRGWYGCKDQSKSGRGRWYRKLNPRMSRPQCRNLNKRPREKVLLMKIGGPHPFGGEIDEGA
jgi:hypothetical protein